MNISVNFEYNIRPEDLDDILCTAFEGGINYWCDKVDVIGDYLGEYASDQISRGGKLILHDTESSDTWELNQEKLLNGIKLAIENKYGSKWNWCATGEIDPCMIDATIADAIVQYALFGELVYG